MKDKYQEALDIIKKTNLRSEHYVQFEEDNIENVYEEEINILQELVDKEKSRKPITHTQEGVYAIPLCPKCKKPLNEHKDKPNYCSNCGQRLDWSDIV